MDHLIWLGYQKPAVLFHAIVNHKQENIKRVSKLSVLRVLYTLACMESNVLGMQLISAFTYFLGGLLMCFVALGIYSANDNIVSMHISW